MPHKPNNKTKTTALILAAVVLLALLSYLPSWLGGGAPGNLPQGQAATPFQVHFIDVGQGDSTLILADGHAMLIDGGERGNEDHVTKYLKDQGVERLDYVIATHPHSDHVGGLAYGVLENFPAGMVIAPRFSQEHMPTTQTYEQFLRAVTKLKQQGAQAVFAKPGAQYALGGAQFTILGPLQEDGENYNNDSVAIRVAFQSVSVLLTGDAERAAEARLLKAWDASALQSNIFKAGHHGSKTSSSEPLLRAVMPQAVVISCGVGNSYGHPSWDILDRCKALGVAVYRTDVEGTVAFGSDGVTIWRIAS